MAVLMGRAEALGPRQIPAPTVAFRRHSRGAVAVLAALPVLIFGIPALAGHAVMPSDDVLQNYPLRLLVGSQLRQGHLPLYDPYIWSGAPLLGGWNAGAAYPLTLLFAVMTGTAAWTLNLIVTWWVAGLGTFAFLRASRLSPVASFVGGLSFAFAGAMAAQVAHFGFVAGMSWVPVVLLALLRLSQRRDVGARLAWTAALAGACAMVILAGEPRAIDDGVVVAGLYALWRVVRVQNRSRFAYGGLVTAGVALGVAIGAVQWLPGIDAVASSQRAAHSTALFNSGSLAPKWLFLSLVPDLFGGSGSFGQPTFFAHYNLPEITGYVGLLPLVAAFALLGRLRWRQRLPEWVIWHAVALVGVVLALGGNTVLGPVLLHLPLFGDQRLQSRNIMIADLALAVLLAYWVDEWVRAPRSARRRGVQSARQLLGIVPPLAAVAVVTVTLAWGAGMLRWLGLTSSMANRAGPSAPWLVPFLVLGLVAIAIVIWGPRLDRRRRARLVVCFVALDVGIFSVLTLVAVAPGLTKSPPASVQSSSAHASGQMGDPTSPVVPISDLVHSGRFAIYDPNQYNPNELLELGVSDSNVTTGTPSVEGYSSIVDGTYAQVTGSHQSMGEGQYVLDPKVLSDGTLDQLDTTVLLTPAAYLITPVDPDSTPDGQTGRRQLAAGQSASWYLGTQLETTSVTIPLQERPTADAALRVGLVEESGSTLWKTPSTVSGDALTVSTTRPLDVVALKVVAGARPIDLGAPVVQTTEGESFRADGQLQQVLVAPRWVLRGFDGAFAVFGDSMARPALSLQALPGRPTAGASIRAAGGPAFAPTRARVTSPHGVTVVRAAAMIPGSTASWHPAEGAPSQVLSVRRSGVIQAVTVPAGRGTVVWGYVAPGAALGLWLTAGGLVGVLVLALALVVTRRRRSSGITPPRLRFVGLVPTRLIDARTNVLGRSVSQASSTSSLH